MSKSPSQIELMRNVERKKLYISIKLFLTWDAWGIRCNFKKGWNLD